MFSVFTKVRGAGSHTHKKCGFRLDELRALFPEQMHEYDRWCKMRQDSEKKATDEDDEKDNDDQATDNNAWEGGYMRLRRAQFDQRTDIMRNKTYLSYAEARRQGSFLPQRTTAEDRQWNAANKKTRGKPKDGTWEGKSSCSVQFLYWVGFDPRSALPPPDEAITQALAYIGYDMMGRVVEKAIECKRKDKETASSKNFQLGPGEQLSVKDIEATKTDPEILSLLNGNVQQGEGVKASQLYFGPGFEHRLELELEHMTKTDKSEKDKSKKKDIEKAEDELFESLVTPRILEGVTDVLGEENNEELRIQRSKTKSGQRRCEAERIRKQNVRDGLKEDAQPLKRKRGRPRKNKSVDEEPPKREDTPKRKRGRPRKNSSTNEDCKIASKKTGDKEITGKREWFQRTRDRCKGRCENTRKQQQTKHET
uniref:Uncharacterized protein n=1 Tax=Leptocylindrus danicus TaxID=163516 RepID=A0A7S2K0X2_9STRA